MVLNYNFQHQVNFYISCEYIIDQKRSIEIQPDSRKVHVLYKSLVFDHVKLSLKL